MSLLTALQHGYQKLPKTPPLNPFSCSDSNPKMQQLDQFYRDFSEQWESDPDKMMKRKKKNLVSAKEPAKEENPRSQSFMKLEHHSIVNNKHDMRVKEERTGSSLEGRNGETSSQGGNGGGNVLAEKMKELEMMDVNDMDHVLDIEEVLHYYSHLKCPVYVDIVDKFFMDIYSEFFLPQPSVSVNC
ncbi:hypothetical protein F0562_024667 [Nyssa sinensis]|uniref:OVATE domain-containing protein n=1 Tax=Nyssa sinensis TaxID=561372 RepID=A0A5J5BCN2_9ASTE|nr:hypothetical protein F0562_024667 [Nyssa sinensis]